MHVSHEQKKQAWAAEKADLADQLEKARAKIKEQKDFVDY